MFVCDKNFSCCDFQYWDKQDDVEEEAKECGHLIEVSPVKHAELKDTEREEVTLKSMYQHGYADALEDIRDLIHEKLEELDKTGDARHSYFSGMQVALHSIGEATYNMKDKKGLSSKTEIGYIVRYDEGKFKFIEAPFTIRSSSNGGRVRSKILMHPVDYKEIVDNANTMKGNPNLILVGEPFLLDDDLREKVVKWVEWANKVGSKGYDPLGE